MRTTGRWSHWFAITFFHKMEALEIPNSKQFVFILRANAMKEAVSGLTEVWHKKWRAHKEAKAEHEKVSKDPFREFDLPYNKISMFCVFMSEIGEHLDKGIADIMEDDGERCRLKTQLKELRGACQTLEDMPATTMDVSVGAFSSKYATLKVDGNWKWTLTLTDLTGEPFKQMLMHAVGLLNKDGPIEVALRRQYATNDEDELWEYVKKQPRPGKGAGNRGRGCR
ncbi:unnamed protein product [Prorocentrum cordatum]|uniref:Ubiquitinyl hydrolase 1 n=1 Tax=Prorocentrum cordatum TaxID=2364126 RepID=A0ABN9PV31_9DINO|nr:unnamed protein product [Polarella glacialis]